jgi:8-amino-7-oxononanoate synthase
MALSDKIRAYTEQIDQKGLLRRRVLSDPDDGTLVRFDCNDYLSLIDEPFVTNAYEHGYRHYPCGSGASMLLSGYHPNHRAIEQAFAQLLAVDDCVLFSSGYSANLAITALLGSIHAQCLVDKAVHASIYDGLTLSKVAYTRFLHNDLESLAKKLAAHPNNSVLITEGVFSMSGQIAPLSAMHQLAQVPLIVDEAHSFGILGQHGAGSILLHGLTQNEVPLRVIPLGKACAAQGAMVAGQADWIHALLQAGRSVIYSTALSPALSYGLLKTLEFVIKADDRRLKLVQLIDFFKHKISSSSLNWSHSNSAIQQVRLGCPHRALYYAQELKKNGFSCSAIRAPTVAPQASGLRIVLNYRHTPEQINSLFTTLNALYEHQSS